MFIKLFTSSHLCCCSVQELVKQKEDLTKERDKQLDDIVSVSSSLFMVIVQPLISFLSSFGRELLRFQKSSSKLNSSVKRLS